MGWRTDAAHRVRAMERFHEAKDRLASADTPTRERDAARRDADNLREALAELVLLKDGPRDEHYRATKDAAWERARAALKASWGPGHPGYDEMGQ